MVISPDFYTDWRRVFLKEKKRRESVSLWLWKDSISLPVCQRIFFPFGFTWEEAIVCHVGNSAARPLDDVHRGPVQLPGDSEAEEGLQLLDLLDQGSASCRPHLTDLGPCLPGVILVKIGLERRGRLTQLRETRAQIRTRNNIPDNLKIAGTAYLHL